MHNSDYTCPVGYRLYGLYGHFGVNLEMPLSNTREQLEYIQALKRDGEIFSAGLMCRNIKTALTMSTPPVGPTGIGTPWKTHGSPSTANITIIGGKIIVDNYTRSFG